MQSSATRAAPRRLSLRRVTLGAALALGCAQLFGIEEACDYENDTCGAAGAPGPEDAVAAECAQYCAQMRAKCADPPQYADAQRREEDAPRATECETLCRQFPSSGGESPVGNTRECRIERITSSTGGRDDCLAAGRGGQPPAGAGDGCGTNCDSFCSLMRSLCPRHFGSFDPSDSAADDAAACSMDCMRLRDREDFDSTLLGVDETDVVGDATVQCRLWHLGFAAILVEQAQLFDNAHCDHAMGLDQCRQPP